MLYFPEDISYKSTSGIEFNTTVIATKNGLEQRNINWSQPRKKYNVIEGARKTNKIEELKDFFIICFGKSKTFLYKDWLDYKSTKKMSETTTATDQFLGSGDGVTTDFQIRKIYDTIYGGVTDKNDITITKPKANTLKVAINSTPTTAYSVDDETGIITFNVAPGSGASVTCGFEYYVPCRFASDDFIASLETYNISSSRVDIIEVKE